jgi:hypothetical protein
MFSTNTCIVLILLGLVGGILGYVYYSNKDLVYMKSKKTGKRAKAAWNIDG